MMPRRQLHEKSWRCPQPWESTSNGGEESCTEPAIDMDDPWKIRRSPGRSIQEALFGLVVSHRQLGMCVLGPRSQLSIASAPMAICNAFPI